jgi:hypothetical protein
MSGGIVGQEFDFRDLARDPFVERMFTLEIFGWDPAAAAQKNLYFSTHPFATGPMDLPANQIFEPRLSNRFSIHRALFAPGLLAGRSEAGVGSLTLVNNDGALDYMATLAITGRPVRVSMGGVEWGYTYFGFVFQGTCDGIDFTEDAITIRLRDRIQLLDRELQELRLDSTIVNNPDVYNRLRPKVLGTVKNIEPVYVGTDVNGKPIYHTNDNTGWVWVKAVYDRGVPLTRTTAAIPAAGQFKGLVNYGSITLAAEPAGTLTADIIQLHDGINTTLTNLNMPLAVNGIYTFTLPEPRDFPVGGKVVIHPRTYGNWYLNHYEGTVTAASAPGEEPITITVKINEASSQATTAAPVANADWSIWSAGHPLKLLVDAFSHPGQEFADMVEPLSWGTRQQWSAAWPDQAGIWLPEGGNAIDILDYIATGSSMYYYFNRDGGFSYGRLFRPEQWTDISAYLTPTEIVRLERMATDEPVWSTTVRRDRNWTVMKKGDLAGGVTQAFRQFALEEWRSDTLVNTAIRTNYPNARTLDVNSIFTSGLNPGLATTLRNIFQIRRDYFRTTVKTAGVLIDLGHVVNVTFPRWGLNAGKNFLVIDIEDNYDTNEIVLGLWG